MTASPQDGPPRRKVHVGVKLLIGCLAVMALGFVGIAVAVGIGGFALKRGVEAVAGQADDHREATALLDRLERDYPFRSPVDGVVPTALRLRFASVTDRVWSGMRDWAGDALELDDRTRSRPDRRANLGDAVTAARAAGGVVRARIVLARSLAAERVSLSEYVWTGHALRREGPLSPETADGNAEMVLNVASLWARSEGLTAAP